MRKEIRNIVIQRILAIVSLETGFSINYELSRRQIDKLYKLIDAELLLMVRKPKKKQKR